MRFAPFAALAAMASAVFVMASPLAPSAARLAPSAAREVRLAPSAAREVRAPEPSAARVTPTVSDVIDKLQTDLAGPTTILKFLDANNVTDSIIVEQSEKISSAVKDAVNQLVDLQSVQDLSLLFGVVGWVNSVISVSGISLNTLAALAHGLTLLTGGSPNVRADPQPSIIDAVAQFSALFSNFLGLFNGTLSYLLTPAIQAFTGQLQGNLEPLLSVFGRATYIFYQQTSGLLYLLATDPPSK